MALPIVYGGKPKDLNLKINTFPNKTKEASDEAPQNYNPMNLSVDNLQKISYIWVGINLHFSFGFLGF